MKKIVRSFRIVPSVWSEFCSCYKKPTSRIEQLIMKDLLEKRKLEFSNPNFKRYR